MYIAKLIKHKGENRIAVYFENKTELIARFKKLKGAKWSATLRVWHLPDSEESRQKFKLKIRENTKPENQLSAEVQLQKEKFVQWLRSKRYSESTIKTYSDAIRVFLHFFSDKALNEIENNDIIVFNNEYILKNKLSASYQNQMVNAIKLFFRTMQNAIAERVNGILKDELLEEVHDDYETALNNIAVAISTYNHLRPHSSIEMLTPVIAHQLNRPLKRTWKNYYKRKEEVMA